jgi:predicted nucleic acid-binding protein
LIVVDASIAAAWVLPEIQTQAAVSLLQTRRGLVAVDLIKVEVFSAILKAVRIKRLTPAHAASAIENFNRVRLTLEPMGDVVPAAYDIAQRHSGSIYDACYIALARSLAAPLATDDEAMAKTAEAVDVTVHRASTGFAALLD